MKAVFVVKRNDEHGTLGLAMKGRRWADPYSGMAAAHDMMEHAPNDDGSPEGELMALGASLVVRDGPNYYAAKGQHYTDPAENFGPEIAYEQLRYLDGRRFRDPGRTTRLSNEEDEATLQRVLDVVCKTAREELDEDTWKFFTTQRAEILGWMRRGARQAERRYRGIQRWHLCHVFSTLEKKLDQVLKYAEEGYEIRVSVNPRTEQVVVEEIYEYET